MVERFGLALVRPREALALAGNRRNAGRSGSDLLLAFVVLVVATQLRAIVGAVWLGAAVEPVLGVRAIIRVLTDALTVDLGFLVLSALILWASAGPRRELGRAFDLACVAVLPLLFVDLAATTVVFAFSLTVGSGVMMTLSAIAYAWTGVLVALAVIQARRPPQPPSERSLARKAGWGIVVLAVLGVAVQGIWLARNLERVQPMTQGDPAPAFVLPKVTQDGKLGEAFTLESTKGKVTVLDFWATWCNPCLKAMPHLEKLQKDFPDIAVVTINIDDFKEARAIFAEKGYQLTLLAGDQATSQRYGVDAIPHTVVIDREGRVRRVVRGGGVDLHSVVAPLLK
ncbi:MAG: TlpA family protein disulfide reductase [Kofleriaceae bacterium]|nr:TlpA family protein disulfide reductase [Kofleriaceae bacterium]